MNERDIAKHVSTGELQQTGSEFVCNICSSSLGQQPMQHIQGTAHKNAVFLQALSQPLKYKALYSTLPQVVQDAHGKGVVRVKDAKFECGPCKMVFSGEKPLTDHLSSSKHQSKEARQGAQMVLTPPTAGPSTVQPTFPPLSHVNHSASFGQTVTGQPSLIHPVVANAVRDGHVKATGSTDFQCTLCEDTKVIPGVEPMRQHLEGKIHKKSLQKRQLQEAGQRRDGAPIYSQQPSYPSQSLNQERLAGFGFPHPSPPSHPSGSLDQGSSKLAFDLSSLNQNITVNVTLPSPYPPAGEAEAGAKYPCGFDAGPVPMETPRKVAQVCNAYKNSSSPRGIVVIFNYIFKNNFGKLRKGARKDHENLQAIFKKIGYEVWPINIDLTRQETLNKLDEVRKSPKLRKVDSLITVFLSHGGQSEDEFMAFDEETISVDEILYTKFTDQQCPSMKGKPKLFIFNYSRGPSNQVQNDSVNSSTDIHEAPSDVAIIQATLPHCKALRNTETGTIFVSEFCKVLEQYSSSMELVDIIYETSKQMRKNALGNTPTVTQIHFGKFKFM